MAALLQTDPRSVQCLNMLDLFVAVAGDVLRGTSPQDQALVQQWVNLAEGEIVPSLATWVYPTGVAAHSEKVNVLRFHTCVCVQRCSSVCHCCVEICITVSFDQFGSSPLTSLTLNFCPQNCCSLDVSFSAPFSAN